MQDTIIKGSGNSRTLKTVPNALTLYPDWTAALQAMINGTFPIDIGPLNPAGLDAKGTDLSKSTLLTEATESYLWGYPINATPNDALWQLRSLIAAAENTANSKSRYQTGYFIGSGVGTRTLSFNFTPRLVVIIGLYSNNISNSGFGIFLNPSIAGITIDGNGTRSCALDASWGDNNLSWTDTNNSFVAGPGYTYHYIAIG